MTPEEWAAEYTKEESWARPIIASVVRAALRELDAEHEIALKKARADALGAAVRIVHEEHVAAMAAAPTYAQIGSRIEYRIRALLEEAGSG